MSHEAEILKRLDDVEGTLEVHVLQDNTNFAEIRTTQSHQTKLLKEIRDMQVEHGQRWARMDGKFKLMVTMAGSVISIGLAAAAEYFFDLF